MNEMPHPGFDKPEEYETFTTTNGLEEAAKEYMQGEIDSGHDCLEVETNEPLYYPEAMKHAFIAGAKWQADHTPLPEDTVLFYKGVEEGKRLMMEEMSECFVQLKQVQSESINISAVREQLAYNRGASDERYKMRKKMMEDAVEGEVYKFGEVAYVKERNNAELTKYLSQFNNGDRVKIIVIHETDIR